MQGAFIVLQTVSMHSRVGKYVMLGNEKIDRCKVAFIFHEPVSMTRMAHEAT